MSKLLALLEKKTLEWARKERKRQERAVEALVASLHDQLMENGLRTDDLRDGIAAMKSAKAADRLHPVRIDSLVQALLEQHRGSPADALQALTRWLGDTIILIPGNWFADAAGLKFENRFELPMTPTQDGGQAVDGAALRKGYAAYEMRAGRFPNVLVARTLGEGCSLRISLLSALGYPPGLTANLEVRADEQVQEGTFYLMIDEDKEDL